MRIVKLLALAIVENMAENKLTNIRVSLAEKFGKCMREGDYCGAGIIKEVIEIEDQKIRDWERKWVDRISSV